MKKTIFSFLMLGMILGLTCDAFAIQIWVRYKDWREQGDMIIYNNTDAKVIVTGSDGWNHKDLLDSSNKNNGPIQPYSLRADPNMPIENDSNNKGFLLLSIESQDGSKVVDDFEIEAKTAHDSTNYELHSDNDSGTQWTFALGEKAVSGAVAIPDDGVYVAQMFNDRYVVTFSVNNEADSPSGNDWTGNTKIILLISNNDEGSFSDDSVDSDWPGSWMGGLGELPAN